MALIFMKRLPPADRMNGGFDERGHDGDTQPTSGHHEYLDKFPFTLKILTDHQRGAIARHSHAHSHDSG